MRKARRYAYNIKVHRAGPHPPVARIINYKFESETMKKNHFKLKSILFAACCLTAMTAFAGCDGNNDKDSEIGILKPISQHITGKWNLVTSYMKKDGKWVESPIPEGQEWTYTIRTDGTVVNAVTAADGFTTLKAGTWTTDEKAGTLTMAIMTANIYSLDATSFEMGYHGKTTDTETGEEVEGDFKWRLTRMDETVKTPAEKLVGKWVFKSTYEKKDGEWKEYNKYEPDEAWVEYREDGTGKNYYKAGNKEYEMGGGWSFNNKTFQVRTTKEGSEEAKVASPVTFEDDNTYSTAYTECYDPATGQIVATGEFKDVWVRSQQ